MSRTHFSPKIITAQQLKEKIDSMPDLVVINVLDQQTYVDCHITTSINIPYENLVEVVSSWDKDKDIALYCAQNTCPKSSQACALLADLGFYHVYLYEGGIKDWLKSGFDVSGMCAMKYLHE